MDPARAQAGILSLETLEDRFEYTSFLDTAETERAHQALDQDRRWLEGRARRGSLQ